jgi:translation initiation factor IF-2
MDENDSLKGQAASSGVVPLTLSRPSATKKSDAQVVQSFSHGRSKAVTVEVKRKRVIQSTGQTSKENLSGKAARLTTEEQDTRFKAVKDALQTAATEKALAEREAEEARLQAEREAAEAAQKALEEAERLALLPTPMEALQEPVVGLSPVAMAPAAAVSERSGPSRVEPRKKADSGGRGETEDEAEAARDHRKRSSNRPEVRRSPAVVAKESVNRTSLTRLYAGSDGDDAPEQRRGRRFGGGRKKMKAVESQAAKVFRDVTIPPTITIQELASRMSEKGADVIRILLKMGVPVTLTQAIDADTAELVVTEMGHVPLRVSEEASVAELLKRDEDGPDVLRPRPPVVTIMGHVDHGKTSLLDALRKTNVVSGEAGGITQHIGAYQIILPGGKITFIDTPGHAAFTQMRARGAHVTDLVILVVAADDGVKEQTAEAIRHAREAGVPLIVAINKMDKNDANPDLVRNMLLSHEVVVESLGGDVQDVLISARTGMNLDKLEEAVLLQAEILALKASPVGRPEGTILEARLEKGRGPVATVLVQHGTLKVGDTFVSGATWGRVRALLNDQGIKVAEALPSQPVEIIGFESTPSAGDDFVVLGDDSTARNIAEMRDRKRREAASVISKPTLTLENFMAVRASEGKLKELPLILKADVQGSLEAIQGSLLKIATDEVQVRILYSGVGGITESDIHLAKASRALVLGFNVRANIQAREVAGQNGVEIRYYSIIYNLIDEVKAALSGLLSPIFKENFLGNAEIRQVFNITKVGKIAGCYVTSGMVRRGARVRLLRDHVVIHEGALKTLKRNKDEVREVRESYECGMAFESYQDIRVGDVIECFEVETIQRSL